MHKYILMVIAAVFQVVAGESTGTTVVVSDSAVLLVNTSISNKRDKDKETIGFTFNFIGDKPVYFYELDHAAKNIKLKFVNTKMGGFFEGDSTIPVVSGPLIDVLVHQELKNKNENVVGLREEWYYVTTATFKCDPLLKNESMLNFTETNSSISLNLIWPKDQKKRAEIYFYPKPKRHPHIWIFSGVGVGIIGAGGLLYWKFFRDEPGDASLKTVLPEHP